MMKRLKKLSSFIFLLLFSSSAYACQVTVDGYCVEQFDMVDYYGLAVAPPVAPSGHVRTYFNSNDNEWYFSKDGSAYQAVGSGAGVTAYTVATLPGSPSDGDIAVITDGADASDCTTGGGTALNVCLYDAGGGAWVIAGDGTGGSGSLGTNLSSTTDDLLSNNGTFLLGGTGNTNNERLDFDFETTANEVAVSSPTGATDLDFGTIDLRTDTIDFNGTGTINGLDTIDATTEATLEGALDLQELQGAVTDAQVPDSITITNNVTAGANITDNAIVRGDGGAKGVQSSVVTIDDSGNMAGVGTLGLGGSITMQNGEILSNSADGQIRLAGGGGTNNEIIYFDLESTANRVILGSTTGVFGLQYSDDFNNFYGSGGNDSAIQFDTAETNDTMKFGTALNSVNGSGNFAFVELADMSKNISLPLVTNPTVHIHSADATDTTQSLRLYHDQTDGNIDVGSGNLNINTGLVFENGETIMNAVDDFLVISGGGGTTDADLMIDLDGSRPIINSPSSPEIKMTEPLHLESDGTANLQEIVLVVQSDTSGRPVIQFSETTDEDSTGGMSLEYDGRGSGTANSFVINSLSASPLMRLTNGGLFGIGNITPTSMLDVGGGTLTSADGTDDLLVKDDIEVDGDAYVEGSLNVGGAGNKRLTFNTNAEYIDNTTDDEILFQGAGGADNTDIKFDLDGTRPVISSPTDTAIEIAEDFIVGGTIDLDKGTGYGQLKTDGSAGSCDMRRDTDDAGWTECIYLNGMTTCGVDADGACDGTA